MSKILHLTRPVKVRFISDPASALEQFLANCKSLEAKSGTLEPAYSNMYFTYFFRSLDFDLKSADRY